MDETRKKEEEMLRKCRSRDWVNDPKWAKEKERSEKNKDTAKKIARLLAESRTEYGDVDYIFAEAKDYLAVTLVEDDA